MKRKWTLGQLLGLAESMGYDRYSIEGDPSGTKITCGLLKPGENEPSVTAAGPYGLAALSFAVQQAIKETTNGTN